MFRMLKAGAVVVIVGVLDPTPSSKALGALSSCLVVASKWLDSLSVNLVLFALVLFFFFFVSFVLELCAF
jgi:hypothetical protein